MGNPNAICGCDFAGTVVSLGESLKTPLQIGDKVCGSVHGGLYITKGSFAEYARAESDLVMRVPEGLDQEAASNFGIPYLTALHVRRLTGVPSPKLTGRVSFTAKTDLGPQSRTERANG